MGQLYPSRAPVAVFRGCMRPFRHLPRRSHRWLRSVPLGDTAALVSARVERQAFLICATKYIVLPTPPCYHDGRLDATRLILAWRTGCGTSKEHNHDTPAHCRAG